MAADWDRRALADGHAVLVVDDDPIVRETLSVRLDAWGFEALTASNVPEALGAVTDGEPGAAIVDLVLPGRRGLDLLRELRASGRTLPVVLITAHGGLQAARAALLEGAEDVLVKPLRPERLRDVLETVLAGGRRSLPSVDAKPTGPARSHRPAGGPPSVSSELPLGRMARRAERLLLFQALEQSGGDEAEAAHRLGVPVEVLRAKRCRYG